MLEVPEILNIPAKLTPIISRFNDFRYFLIEGGRGSGKTHSVARFILFLCEQKNIRVVCGRETQNSIIDSVYTVFSDLIRDFNLNWTVLKHELRHNSTGSVIRFRGFREQGSINIKGLENVNILWVDEAQAISKQTLDILIPTLIRNEKTRLFFTMNRYVSDDAVYDFLAGKNDCLHININYYDNPFCSLSTKIEAEDCKNRSIRDYNHIWLGIPLSSADNALFDSAELLSSNKQPEIIENYGQRVIGIDFAAQGGDLCVATILDRISLTNWKIIEQISWSEPDSMVSVGRIVSILGTFKPTVSILDVGGMGHVVYNRLVELGIKIQRFDGASVEGVDTKHYVNARADGYYNLKDWFSKGWICIDKKFNIVLKELEKIKFKFRSDGRRLLQSKQEMRAENTHSPDHADSLMMAVWAIRFVGKDALKHHAEIKRINVSRRK